MNTPTSREAPELTPDEARLVRAYRIADDYGRDFVMAMAIKEAATWPRRRPGPLALTGTAPALRLV